MKTAALRLPCSKLGARNASLETGLANPLDDAILAARQPDLTAVRKLGEIPFDFVRKRVSVVIAEDSGARLIAKGAFAQMIEVCSHTRDGAKLDQERVARLQEQVDGWSDQGTRVLAVAERRLPAQVRYGRDEERDLMFAGFLTFADRPKPGAARALADLARLGVCVKLITGDSRRVGAIHRRTRGDARRSSAQRG